MKKVFINSLFQILGLNIILDSNKQDKTLLSLKQLTVLFLIFYK